MHAIRRSVFVLVTLVVIPCAKADLYSTFSFSQGNLAAEATFAIGDDEPSVLKVTLTNTSTYAVHVPSDVLTAVYFDLPGVTLTPLYATLGTGSSVLFPATGSGVDSDGEIGGEYGYLDDLTVVPSGANAVISGVGLDDLVGPHDLFPGEGLWNPASPNGLGYGIISFIDDDSNSKVSGAVPLVQNSVVFSLGLPKEFDPFSISGVMFNYGTEFNPQPTDDGGGGGPPMIPAPPAAMLGAVGLALVGWKKLRGV